jgi:TRIAD3 protein (E3 ubiquitin-protein ligase RNF216)
MLLGLDFRNVPSRNIDQILAKNGGNLFQTYRELDQTDAAAAWKKLKKPRRQNDVFSDARLRKTADDWKINDESSRWEQKALLEMHAARKIVPLLKRMSLDRKERKVLVQQAKEFQEEENLRMQKELGNMGECGCCFDETPLNRMAHCDGAQQHVSRKCCAGTSGENH